MGAAPSTPSPVTHRMHKTPRPAVTPRAVWAELAPPLRVALVVGTALCIVNGTYSAGPWYRVALNYAVPFLVSSWSRFTARRDGSRDRPGGGDAR